MSKENNTNKTATYETKSKNKKYLIAISVIVIVIALITIGLVIWNNTKEKTNHDKQISSEKVENKENENMNNEEVKNPIVTMKIKDYGTVKIELYPDVAPNTVKNFISLVNEGYYNGLVFHRIVENFVVQGGDGTGISDAESKFTIPGEFSKNGYTNNLSHKKGVISMARADYTYYGKEKEGYNSASTQFFIMLEDNRSLDGLYAAFGKVIEGMEVIKKMGLIETDSSDRPIDPPVIEMVTVDTFEVDYENPERLEPFDIYAYINGR